MGLTMLCFDLHYVSTCRGGRVFARMCNQLSIQATKKVRVATRHMFCCTEW